MSHAERWQSLMQRINTEKHTEMYLVLKEKYSEKHRHYHNLTHIEACLALLEKYQCLAQNPAEIELALWFHDAVYDVFSSTNEEDSAKMAFDFLIGAGVDITVANRVFELVMVTLHGRPIINTDQALMVDIDLSILGSSTDLYQEFEQAIRKEYKKIPSFLYKRGRKKVLSGFLGREHIYTTPVFQQEYETQARENVTRALAAL